MGKEKLLGLSQNPVAPEMISVSEAFRRINATGITPIKRRELKETLHAMQEANQIKSKKVNGVPLYPIKQLANKWPGILLVNTDNQPTEEPTPPIAQPATETIRRKPHRPETKPLVEITPQQTRQIETTIVGEALDRLLNETLNELESNPRTFFNDNLPEALSEKFKHIPEDQFNKMFAVLLITTINRINNTESRDLNQKEQTILRGLIELKQAPRKRAEERSVEFTTATLLKHFNLPISLENISNFSQPKQNLPNLVRRLNPQHI